MQPPKRFMLPPSTEVSASYTRYIVWGQFDDVVGPMCRALWGCWDALWEEDSEADDIVDTITVLSRSVLMADVEAPDGMDEFVKVMPHLGICAVAVTAPSDGTVRRQALTIVFPSAYRAHVIALSSSISGQLKIIVAQIHTLDDTALQHSMSVLWASVEALIMAADSPAGPITVDRTLFAHMGPAPNTGLMLAIAATTLLKSFNVVVTSAVPEARDVWLDTLGMFLTARERARTVLHARGGQGDHATFLVPDLVLQGCASRSKKDFESDPGLLLMGAACTILDVDHLSIMSVRIPERARARSQSTLQPLHLLALMRINEPSGHVVRLLQELRHVPHGRRVWYVEQWRHHLQVRALTLAQVLRGVAGPKTRSVAMTPTVISRLNTACETMGCTHPTDLTMLCGVVRATYPDLVLWVYKYLVAKQTEGALRDSMM